MRISANALRELPSRRPAAQHFSGLLATKLRHRTSITLCVSSTGCRIFLVTNNIIHHDREGESQGGITNRTLNELIATFTQLHPFLGVGERA